MARARFLLVLVSLLSPAPAFGQLPVPTSGSHWGISFSATPQWRAPLQRSGPAYDRLYGGTLYGNGMDFRVGIARGKDRGGDWGVSYVRQLYKNDSVIDNSNQVCGLRGPASSCLKTGDEALTRGVALNGVVGHYSLAIVNIKNIVQIGGTIGAGVGVLQGTVEDHIFYISPAGPLNFQGQFVESYNAKEFPRYKVLPLLDLLLSATTRVGPGLKLRGSWGVVFPGLGTGTLSLIYFPGSR